MTECKFALTTAANASCYLPSCISQYFGCSSSNQGKWSERWPWLFPFRISAESRRFVADEINIGQSARSKSVQVLCFPSYHHVSHCNGFPYNTGLDTVHNSLQGPCSCHRILVYCPRREVPSLGFSPRRNSQSRQAAARQIGGRRSVQSLGSRL